MEVHKGQVNMLSSGVCGAQGEQHLACEGSVSAQCHKPAGHQGKVRHAESPTASGSLTYTPPHTPWCSRPPPDLSVVQVSLLMNLTPN